ncbi:hypothetical protein CANCADRAFT_57953 [Tortispora caseinolytica NRRL Y-17796]|uniref:Origin recognition complex subunit 1 n=1 Tax=Tortispora caseinolytica NRRL Y-17796 TaxID=767744 RepID=A0A1E4TB41_9ASCO|nr:hypothetical protein CANCADRAFT_57953 [Tortispora caseinolytica NRRL Y-17796]
MQQEVNENDLNSSDQANNAILGESPSTTRSRKVKPTRLTTLPSRKDIKQMFSGIKIAGHTTTGRNSEELIPLPSDKSGNLSSEPKSQADEVTRRLHLSHIPRTLPGRDEQFSLIVSELSAAIRNKTGSCMYISGTPGTGKTITVRHAVSTIFSWMKQGSINEFRYIEINGMRTTTQDIIYEMIWEGMTLEPTSKKQALERLTKLFHNREEDSNRIPTVILVDELDQLLEKNVECVYNLFNWPTMPNSNLIVIAIANTMDIPERHLSNKTSSRLGLTRILFPGYSTEELVDIVTKRVEDNSLISKEAIEFACRRVAAVRGDARRVLHICEKAIEMKQSKQKDKDSVANIADVRAAMAESTEINARSFLRSLPLSCHLALAAICNLVRRRNNKESTIEEVIDECKNVCQMSANKLAEEQIFAELFESGRQLPTLMGAISLLVRSGIVTKSMTPGLLMGKVKLNISATDIQTALQDILDSL